MRLLLVICLGFAQACIAHGQAKRLLAAGASAPTPVDERVLEYGPIGQQSSDSIDIAIRFDRDIVTPGPLGFLDAGGLLRFDPPIEGRAQWRGPDVVRFHTGRLPQGTTYTATLILPDELAGESPFQPLLWSFTTARPICDLFDLPRPHAMLKADEPILFRCSGEIAREHLGEHVTALANRHVLPIDLSILSDHAVAEPVSRDRLTELAGSLGERAEGVLVVRPRFPWPNVRTIAVRLSPDLRMKEGPLGLGKEAVFVVQDIRAFELVEVVCDKSEGQLEAWFSRPVPSSEIARISVSPSPGEVLPRYYQGRSDGNRRWGYRIAKSDSRQPYTVEIPADLVDSVGQTIARPSPVSLTCPPRFQASIDGGLSNHGVVRAGLLEADKPWRVQVAMPKRASATILAASLSDADFLRLLPSLIEMQGRASDHPGESSVIDSSKLPLVLSTVEGQGDYVDLSRIVHATDRAAWIEIRAADHALAAGIYQVTKGGMQAWLSDGPGVVQAFRIADGAPLSGVHIHRLAKNGELSLLGRTNRDGLFHLASRMDNGLPKFEADKQPESHDIVVATDNRQRVLGFIEERGEAIGTRLASRGSYFDGLLITPRDLYAPSETVPFTAFVVATDPSEETGYKAVPDGTECTVELAKDDVVARTRIRIDVHGKAWGALQVPAVAKPGEYSLSLAVHLPDEEQTQSVAHQRIRIGTYNPSDFALTMSTSSSNYLAGDPIRAELSATYRSGGRVPLSRAEGTLSCTHSRPFSDDVGYGTSIRQDVPIHVVEGALNRGFAHFQFTPVPSAVSGPQHCSLSLTVWDQASRIETATTAITLHPSRYYLDARVEEGHGRRPPRVVLQALNWERLPVTVKAIEIAVLGDDSRRLVQSWKLDLPAARISRMLSPLPDGDYVVEFRGNDEGRPVRAIDNLHVSRKVVIEDGCFRNAELHLNAPEKAAVGNTIVVSIDAPKQVRSGLLVVSRNGVQASHPLRFAHGHVDVSIPVAETWFPHVHLYATAVRTNPWERPTLLQAETDVEISSPRRTLAVKIAAPETAVPGEEVEATVNVRDGLGRIPKHARLSFWAVDEGVLALTGYRAFATAMEPSEAWGTSFAENVGDFLQPAGLENPNQQTICAHAPDVIPGQANTRGESDSHPPRSRFETTPFFSGDSPVNMRGEAKVRFRLPHNLTTFRLTAIASAAFGDTEVPVAIGTGEAKLRTSLPLLVKPVFPSKLRPGDKADAVGLVQNLTGKDGEVSLAIEVVGDHGVLSAVGPELQSERLDTNDVRRLAVRLRAGKEGKVVVRWRALLREGGVLLGEDTADLPVEVAGEPRPREILAQTGHLAQGGAKPLRVPVPPAGADWAQAELAVRLSGGLLGEAEPAARALLSYPFRCSEQTASRIIALALAPKALVGLDETDYAQLLDGVRGQLGEFPFAGGKGIGFWPNTEPSLFATAWTTLALAAASASKLPLDDNLRRQARIGLLHLLAHERDDGPEDLRALGRFAFVEAGGVPPKDWATQLAAMKPTATPFAKAMAILTLHALSSTDPRLRRLVSQISIGLDENTATARVGHAAEHTLPSQSNVVDQAAVLWAFARAWPEHTAVAKLTQSLLSLRDDKAWNSTFENAIALFALSAMGALRGDLTTRQVSLDFAGQHLLSSAAMPADGGALTRNFAFDKLMSSLGSAGADKIPMTISTDGPLWYSVVLSYVPADEGSASNRGIAIATPYRTRFGALGSYESVAEGDIVAVDVSLQAEQDSDQVAVEVPLPAGFEPYDLSLAGRANALAPNLAPQRQLKVDNVEFHPDRIRLFIRQLPHGLPHHYTVYAIARVPGTYIAPGATAQAMYSPNTRGRGLSRVIRILSPTELANESSAIEDTLGL